MSGPVPLSFHEKCSCWSALESCSGLWKVAPAACTMAAGLQTPCGLKKRLEDLLSLIPALQTQSKALVAPVVFR